MSYQVLARKWRPKSFPEMVGQEHVLRAMVNALEQGRLHHAYLFTGTRGVGKTTIARILAKSLNCDTGVTANPCGVCSACREIDEGRFVDLIEVDAASRTKVEDTRELLENVQYAPTRGRYKVYLIDEVHMLSGHSFNALLKTLEEPPAHVKFLLATTDPQKLPITILSRCLQFSLKAMTPERIVQHLRKVLTAENVSFEEGALWALGRAAQGSMRDAMSLTDQAIAFGNGAVAEAEVRDMLGTIDRDWVWRLLQPLADQDNPALFEGLRALADQAPDYAGVLADVIATLHRVATAQVYPEAVDDSEGDRQRVIELAQRLSPEDVQLYYQLALLGRRDLPLAPDARVGFEMVMMRMMLFRPLPPGGATEGARPAARAAGGAATVGGSRPAAAGGPVATARPVSVAPAATATTTTTMPAVSTGNAPAAQAVAAQQPSLAVQPVSKTVAQSAPNNSGTPAPSDDPPPWVVDVPALDPGGAAVMPVAAVSASSANAGASAVSASPAMQAAQAIQPAAPATRPVLVSSPAVETARASTPVAPEMAQPAAVATQSAAAATSAAGGNVVALSDRRKDGERAMIAGSAGDRWSDLLNALGLTGPLLNMARNCALEQEGSEAEPSTWHLAMSPKHEFLHQPQRIAALEQALSAHLGKALTLLVEVREPGHETPDMRTNRIKREQLERAEQCFVEDPFVKSLVTEFSAVVERHSIRPADDTSSKQES